MVSLVAVSVGLLAFVVGGTYLLVELMKIVEWVFMGSLFVIPGIYNTIVPVIFYITDKCAEYIAAHKA